MVENTDLRTAVKVKGTLAVTQRFKVSLKLRST